MESEILARRKRTSEEIQDALQASGMSRKEFAVKMGRQPSEVTKWLSGKHNFTSDLLAEISAVLSSPISGAEESLGTKQLVGGYADTECDGCLCDSGCTVMNIVLPREAAAALVRKASDCGMSLREYVRDLLCAKAAERGVSAYDFNCIWKDDCPDIDDIISLRVHNTVKEL